MRPTKKAVKDRCDVCIRAVQRPTLRERVRGTKIFDRCRPRAQRRLQSGDLAGVPRFIQRFACVKVSVNAGPNSVASFVVDCSCLQKVEQLFLNDDSPSNYFTIKGNALFATGDIFRDRKVVRVQA